MSTVPTELEPDTTTVVVLTLTVRRSGTTIEGHLQLGTDALTFEGWSGLGAAVQECLDRVPNGLRGSAKVGGGSPM